MKTNCLKGQADTLGMSSIIEVRNVTKKYADEKVALADLSVNIIGPNAIYLAMMKQTDWSESQVRNSFSPLCIHTRTGMRVRAHANWHAVSSLLCEGSPRR